MKNLKDKASDFSTKIRRLFSENAPDWLYAFFAMIYSALHPERSTVFLTPLKYCWCSIRGDRKFYIPRTKSSMWITCPDADTDRARIIDMLNPGDTVLDVGAHTGKNTLKYAQKVGENGLIVAIEASPINLHCLTSNIRENNECRNIKVVEKAIWDERAKLELHMPKPAAEHSLTPQRKVEEPRKIRVQGDTLDNILEDLGIEKVDLMKMDIQGAEIEALNGAKKCLDQIKKVIVFGDHIRNGKPTAIRVSNILENHFNNIEIGKDEIVYASKE